MKKQEPRISRREFLKLLGSASAVMLSFLAFGYIGPTINIATNNNKNKRNTASAQSAGSWSSGPDTVDVGIHAALLNGGKVFYLAGSGNHNPQVDGPYNHAIWNPATNTQTEFTLGEDLFCAGMCTLANGNLLLAGGTLAYDFQTLNGKFQGLKAAYEVDFTSGVVGNRTEMAHGRWYPTCVALPDGKVVVVQGSDEYGCSNKLVEMYDPANKTWTLKFDPDSTLTYCVGFCATEQYPEAGQTCYGPGTAPALSLYPRMHLMPNGLVFVVGQGTIDWVHNLGTGKWQFAGSVVKRSYGTTVLCPLQNTASEKGKILIVGGSPTPSDPTTNIAQIAEPSGSFGISRRNIQSMTYARRHQNPVILPTGQIIILGGNAQGNAVATAVYTPEMFDPATETWSLLPNHAVPRLYHSVALLLQDGRVWTAGTTLSFFQKELRTEVFTPWYVSETRPIISGDTTGGAYGSTITIPTPDAANIAKVSLVRVSSTTHHYNTDQRLIWLQIVSNTPTSVTVSSPINANLAPPGMYLIHILNSAGVPSIGKFAKIPGAGVFITVYSVTATNSYLKLFTGDLKRAGEMMTPASILKGNSVKKVDVILKKSGNPTGPVNVVARKGSDDSISVTFGTIDASTLIASDQTYSLTAPSSHIIADNDKILIEWNGTGSSTDQVWIKRRFSSDPASGFDGSNTKQAHYKTSYSSHLGSDLAGKWYKET